VLALSVPTLIIHGEGEAASHVVCTPYGSCKLCHTHVMVQKRKQKENKNKLHTTITLHTGRDTFPQRFTVVAVRVETYTKAQMTSSARRSSSTPSSLSLQL
jgi:hypothetical protein